ncbi:hypothetical protein [Metasolibacillus meyeri]|uniref:hypothetical protein n=1 Tax=Metasolibacillus meyeri TaxID=1071052 RepID=UPI000D307565|nr:hypothetical protein [Metasolibacillus meyeri]
MNANEILKHCVIVEITQCEKDSYWYSNLVGKQLVAYAYNPDYQEIYCCHIDDMYNSQAVIPVANCKIVQGNLNQLADMS